MGCCSGSCSCTAVYPKVVQKGSLTVLYSSVNTDSQCQLAVKGRNVQSTQEKQRAGG